MGRLMLLLLAIMVALIAAVAGLAWMHYNIGQHIKSMNTVDPWIGDTTWAVPDSVPAIEGEYAR